MMHRGKAGRKEKSTCLICNEAESKYSCSVCFGTVHKASDEGNEGCIATTKQTLFSSSTPESVHLGDSTSSTVDPPRNEIQAEKEPMDPTALSDTIPLKPLTSLKWPYIAGEEPAYPDPLERNDPKPLRTRHYEAIATSPAVRKALFSPSTTPGVPDQPNLRLRALLTSIDKLSGVEREQALQRGLEVGDGRINIGFSTQAGAQDELSEDALALRALAEAIEGAVRGNGTQELGLDWD
ncbi:hypothetical protein BT96DRAFT_920130 [Gymnopus androsaceus JB14]|uniref:HIT-type domain-containing protein n=1 Tax=Gymnopus androsaceus JB14 TaxID=1447944 RepID=A0A6A4HKS0_9AGAR|nr:hypothetical protein BT96DRAFT_920130 [Gymnopus androsaceus JB14]